MASSSLTTSSRIQQQVTDPAPLLPPEGSASELGHSPAMTDDCTVEELIEIAIERGLDAELGAAQIWAAATAERDRLPSIPRADDKLPGIHQALTQTGATLHIARRATSIVGFYLLVLGPRTNSFEVLYLATAPQMWGDGIARALLADIQHFALERPASLELWDIADNTRAITTYTRSGWLQTSDSKVRNASGKLEHLLELLPH